ncbi:hypothetical protein [Macrococcoides caseolyticum]|uniref:hypothetical protein n=1 Tax=Macrococcoides caseolyticum TaxID=69966 RepID=UPI000C31F497|nr:hypothetical protein [Macrococcus caseolyticus]PKF04807.1 hypothetical protein CW698_11435 [Macrococcus caseolyticus]
MKNKISKFSVILFVGILILSFSFSGIDVYANTNNDVSNSGVPNELGQKMSQDISSLNEEEAAKEIHYILNNVFIYDNQGNVVGIDRQKSIDRYGYVPNEFTEMENAAEYQMAKEFNNQNCVTTYGYNSSYECFDGEMRKSFADLIPTGVIASLLEDGKAGGLSEANIIKVLKKAGKSVIKGNIYAIAAQMVWIDAKCKWNYPFFPGPK